MKDLFIIVGCIVAAGAGLIALVNTVEGHQCHATAAAMGVKAEYNFWIPCVIEVNGRKMPLKNYRGIDTDE